MKSHNKFLIFTTFLLSILFANIGLAADVTVEMLNRLDKQSNVFEPKIVRVNVGDTVLWKAKDKGHNVEFIKSGAIFLDFDENLSFFIASRFDLSSPTTTKPIIPIFLWGVHQYA